MEELKEFNINYFYDKPIVGTFLKVYDVIDLEETFYLMNVKLIAKFQIKEESSNEFSIIAYPLNSYNLSSDVNDYFHIYGIKEFNNIKEAHIALQTISNMIDEN